MAEYFRGLVDAAGRPIEKKTLTEEIGAATTTGVRSPLTGYPGDGLNPGRLAALLRDADQGDPLQYLELAETIEERDLHYVGVLGTRRRSVSQIEISVNPADDSAAEEEKAERVRRWLQRDELSDDLFDILDAIGKGYSFTEIIWDTSEGQWEPRRLERRDPRWFRPARRDLTTPQMIDENGQELELPGGKFITAVMRAKSGLPVRSGLARIVAWAWMFKAFDNRDWAIFVQTYGQPVRIGKYHSSATREEKNTLYRAVANIAGDCAAIIPDSMMIEFIESKSIGTSGDLFERRADWLDRQVSKAVVGQTTTTDAISGGHAVSREHRQVQEDIERADARALSAILNRDLIRTWIDLEYGPQKKYPRISIARPDEEDLQKFAGSLAQLVPLGLKVSARQVRDKFGLEKPADDDEVLEPRAQPAAQTPPSNGKKPDRKPTPPRKENEPKREILHQVASTDGLMPDEIVGAAALDMAGPALGALVERMRSIISKADSLEDAEAALGRVSGEADPAIVAAMRQAMLLAWLIGDGGAGDGVALQAGFDPNQPRVPKGGKGGGRWTDDPARGAGRPERRFTAQQLATLAGYTAADHRAINWWLRHGELPPGAELDAVMEGIAAMDAILAGDRLSEPLTVFRGIDPYGARRLAAMGLRKGSVLVDPAFMSTSRSINVARWFARWQEGVTMSISVPRGAAGLDVAKVSASPFTEQEVIFARGRRLRVVGWNRKTRILDVEMEP